MGVTNLKEFLVAFVRLGVGVGRAREDGVWSLADAMFFWPFAQAIPAAYEDIALIPAEIKDLDQAEVDQLIADVNQEFKEYPAEKVRRLVAQGLVVAKEIFVFVEIVNEPSPVQ